MPGRAALPIGREIKAMGAKAGSHGRRVGKIDHATPIARAIRIHASTQTAHRWRQQKTRAFVVRTVIAIVAMVAVANAIEFHVRL